MPEPTSPVANPQKKCPCCRRSSGTLVVLVVIAGVVGIVLYARSGGPPAKDSLRETNARPAQSQSPADLDNSFRRMVLGTWEDEYQGKRTMTLKEDGTGTMIVELSG